MGLLTGWHVKTSSAKAKGRRLQQLVSDRLLALYPQLTKRDIKPTSMGVSGVDVQLSEAAVAVFPFSIECKCVEALNIWKALEQAEANAEGLYPLLVFKRNRSEVYAAIQLETLLALIKDSHGPT